MKKLSLLEGLDARVLFAVGAGFVAPVSPRTVVNQNAGWSLNGGAAVTLPYVRNSSSGNTGTDTFTKTIATPAATAGKRLYLHFEGAYLTTSLSVDGTPVDYNPATPAVDAHKGGFQAFDFDVTAAMGTPGNHVVQVTVASNNDTSVAPADGGDYYRQGGIYRDVTLVAIDPTQVAPTERVTHTQLANPGADAASQISGPGVRFSNDDVVLGASSATVHFTTVLNNVQAAARNVTVRSSLVDAKGIVRAEQSTGVALAANAAGVLAKQDAVVASPHLWDGRADPYLYTLYTEVRDASSGKLLDLQKQSVGIRSFRINATTNTSDANPMNDAPFMLNGHAYRVVGADMHQDTGLLDPTGVVAGWERSDAQARADIDLLADMGGTAIRTSHYQDSQAFYDYCDRLGILVYTESPINGGNPTYSDAYISNAEDQYNELVRQNYNHASVFAWGFGNESGSSANLTNLFKGLQAIAGGYGKGGFDTTRYTAYGNYAGSGPNFNDANNSNNIPDILGLHPYTYWYGGQVNPPQNATQPQGVTEYGGGGSAFQYTDNAISLPVGNQPNGGVDTNYHPQNQQAQISQRQYTELTNLGYLWGQFTWQMFDHLDGKTEGDRDFNNDKGLVNRDRVPKDSYYFYKASLNDPARAWANQRVLYISDRNWTVRNSSAATVTVYSNVGTPTLKVNGTSVAMTQLVLSGVTIKNTYTAAVTLADQANAITVDATYAGDGKKYNDSSVWTYHAPTLAGTSTARVDFVSGSQAAASGYVADNGGAYGSRNGATYGWLPAGGQVQAVGSGFTTGSTNLTYSGLNVPFDPIYKTSAVWEYALPNGTYDVRIGAGQSGATDGVNQFTLEGKTAAIDTNGRSTQDTFYSRVTVTDGKLTLAAALGAFKSRITYIDINTIPTSPNNADRPVVSDVTINNGGIQRSTIRNLGISFSEPVTLAANAISLVLRGGASYPVSLTAAADRASYAIKLLSGVSLISLPDGVYDLTVDPTKVADDGGLTMAATYAAAFTKLFGDVNGDRRVDALDQQAFALAKNTKAGVAGYRNDFDYDNDGDVDALDNLRFNQNVGKSLTV